MLHYTILRRDTICPGFGYVVSQHHTLRAALKAYRPHLFIETHLVYQYDGFIAKGSTVGIREGQVVQIEAP